MNKLKALFREEQFMEYLEHYKYHLIGALTIAVTLRLLKTYFEGGKCMNKTRLDGKTVIITGANTGIGKETALDLAKRGARVILACRDVRKAEAAAVEIRRESGNGNVVVEQLDLASFDSVKQFAEQINQNENRVNLLINNAGKQNTIIRKLFDQFGNQIIFGKGLAGIIKRRTTLNGIEMNFAVNHLGHYLLTNLLLDKLEASKPSRIINVSSMGYKDARMDWTDLMFEKNYKNFAAYVQSKLANILFTRELSKRLPHGITTYSLHPGVVKTDITRNMADHYGIVYSLVDLILKPVVWLVFKNAKQGAQTSIHLATATDDQLKNSNGKYFSDCSEQPLLAHALSDTDAMKLWIESEKLVEDFLKK